MENRELYHYGVKGMRWGVRRARRRESWHEDAVTAHDLRKKNLKELSNAEIRKLNDRTNLEQQYRRLHPDTLHKGLKAAAAIVATTGTLLNLYNNSEKAVKLGQKVGTKIMSKLGPKVVDGMTIKV